MTAVRVGASAMLGVVLCVTHAVTQQASFEEGNRLYQNEDYAGAVRAYQQILEDGYESGTLYYNLGNAYFKLGELGLAILNYERARRLMPRDRDVRANLELARSLTTDDITPRPPFFPFAVIRWWVDLLPRSALSASVTFGYLLAVAGLILIVMRPGTVAARWGGRTAIGGGVVTVILGINLAVRELGIAQTRAAIVLAESAAVQSAPSEDPDLQLFTIHEGTRVALDQESAEWVEVALEDGRVGWMRVEALEVI